MIFTFIEIAENLNEQVAKIANRLMRFNLIKTEMRMFQWTKRKKEFDY